MTAPEQSLSYRSLASSGLGANLTALALATTSTFVTATLLGASGRGRVALLMVVASLANVGFSLSLEAGVLRYGKQIGIDRLYRTLIPPLALLTCCCALVLFLYAGYWMRSPLGGVWAAIYAIGFSTAVCIPPLTAIERLRGRHHSATWWSAIIVACQQASGTLAVVWRPTVESFIGAGAAIGLILTVTFLYTTWPAREGFAPKTARPLAPLVAYSLVGHMGVGLHLLGMRAPILIVGILLGDAQAGVYSIASSLAELTLLTTQTQLPYVLARATLEPRNYSPLVAQVKVCLVTSILVLPPMFGAALLVRNFLGSEFSQVPFILVFLAPGSVALAVWRLASYDLTVRGLADLRTWSAGLGATLTSVAGIVLANWVGVAGVAAASSAGYLAMALSFWALALHRLRRRPSDGFQ